MGVEIETVIGVVEAVASSKVGQRLVCGTYSDGKPRSIVDAWRDEIISPKDREKWEKKKAKKKKKKKKAKKKAKNTIQPARW